MGENMEDMNGNINENEVLKDFELKNEISTIVAKNMIPQRIAEKLEKKLVEKQVKINRKQLYLLVDKIRNIMRTYSKFDEGYKKEENLSVRPTEQKIETTTDMKKLFETIDKLQQRIANLENDVMKKGWIYPGEKAAPPKIVKVDDIQVPSQELINLEPLTKIPNDPESIVVLMKWLQYLIDRCGRPNLPEVLDYYVDIGWISEDAKINIMDYSNGITEEITKSGTTELQAKDHIQSLLFIQKIKGKQIDRHFIDRIESEIFRITKKLDSYNSDKII
jgi:flagellar protein FlaD